MSLLSAVLLLVRVVPLEPAIIITRLITISYLLVRPGYRKEIEFNYHLLCHRRDRFFWLKNAWTIGRNLALMAKIGTRLAEKLIDSVRIYQENINDDKKYSVHKFHTIMASFHFGLWEFLPQVYSRYSQDVALITGNMKDRPLNRIIARIRGSSGVRMVSEVRVLLNRIKRAGITGFMLDNTGRGKQIKICTQGLNFRLPTLAFSMSQRNGTGVVPLFGYWDRGRLVVRVFPSQDPEGCVRVLLKMVRERPTEWIFWGKSGAITRKA